MRQPFRLPEYSPRITWASERARAVWEPRIQRISAAYLLVERESVIAGLRPSALQNVSPEELPALMKTLAPHGVIALPLAKTTRAAGYQSATRTLNPSEPWDYRVAITRPQHAASWSTAWEAGDNERIGKLLGYPACCRNFFEQVWVRERWMDTTWPMTRPRGASPSTSSRASGAPDAARSSAQDSRSEAAQRPADTRGEGVEVRGLNMLWRWHGVRPVSHLPCGFHCAASAYSASDTLFVMRSRWPEEAAWMAEILSWPVKWTALHGIAEITTPIHRTSVATDATDRRLEVRYMGTGYPVEGAVGVGFPHRTVATPGSTLQLARPSAQNPAVNGFSTLAAMHEAHQRVLTVAGIGPYRTVLDLGCGDGTLLSRIPAVRRIGLDSNPLHTQLAKSKGVDRVVVGDCTDAATVARVLDEEKPDLIIAQRDRNPLETLPGYRVLSYSYEDGADAPRLIEVLNGTEVRRAVG